MKRRRGPIGLVAGALAALVGLTGCPPGGSSRDQVVRQTAPGGDPSLWEASASGASIEPELPPDGTALFRRDRSPGGWSSRAREIEKDFNIGR